MGGILLLEGSATDGLLLEGSATDLLALEAAPTVAGTASAFATGTSNNPTVTLPTIVDDQLILAFASAVLDTATFTAPSADWTAVGTPVVDTGIYATQLYWKRGVAADSGASVAFGVSGNVQKGVHVIVLNDADVVVPLDGAISGIQEASSTAAHVAGSQTSALVNSLELAACFDRSSTGWTAPAGWTERLDATGTGTNPVSGTIITKDAIPAPGAHTGPTMTGNVSTSTATIFHLSVSAVYNTPTPPYVPDLDPGTNYFTANSYWKRRADAAPVHSNSAAILAFVKAQHVAAGSNAEKLDLPGAAGDVSTAFATPIYWAKTTDTEYNVVFKSDGSTNYGTIPPELATLRIPQNAVPMNNADAEMAIVDLARNYVVWLYHAAFSGGVWKCNGASIAYLDTDSLQIASGGTDPDNYSINAGMNGLVTAIRWKEVDQGVIPHAVRMGMHPTAINPAISILPCPPSEGSGSSSDPLAVPTGMRMRLKASKVITGWSAEAQIIGQMMKTYGLYLGDGAGRFSVMVENTMLEGRGQLWSVTASELNTLVDIASDFEVIDYTYNWSVSAAANLSQSSTLSVSGLKTLLAAASLTASSVLSAAATRVFSAAASLIASSVMSASGVITRFGAANLSQSSVMSATATQSGTQQGAANLSQSSTMSVGPIVTRPASATMTAGSTMSVGPTITRPATAVLSQSSTMSVDGIRIKTPDASLAQSSTLSASATRIVNPAATLSQSSTLSATGTQSGTQQGAAVLVQGSSISASALETLLPSATLSQSSAMSVSGLRTVLPSVVLVATSVMSVTSLRVATPTVVLAQDSALVAGGSRTASAVAALSQPTTLSATGTQSGLSTGSASLVQTTALSASGLEALLAAAVLSSTSTMASGGLEVNLGATNLSAPSAMSVGGAITRLGSANLVASSTMSTSSTRTTFAAATMTQSSVMVASVSPQGSANLIATSTMSSSPTVSRFGAVNLSSTSSMSVSGLETLLPTAALIATSLLAASSVRITYVPRPELIYNGSGKAGMVGFTPNPSYKPARISASVVVPDISPAPGLDTAFQITLSPDDPDVGYGQLFKFLTAGVKVGDVVQLTGWVRGISGGYTSLQPQFYNDPATHAPISGGSFSGGNFAVTSDWTQFTRTAVVVSDSVEGVDFMRFSINNSGISQTIQITGVSASILSSTNFSQPSVLAAGPTRTSSATASLSAPSTMSATPLRIVNASAVLSAPSTMNATSLPTRFSNVVLTQTSAMNAASVIARLANVILSQPSVMLPTAARTAYAAAALVALSVLSADALAIPPYETYETPVTATVGGGVTGSGIVPSGGVAVLSASDGTSTIVND